MVKRKTVKKVLIGIVCLILLVVASAFAIFRNELRSLASLKVIDNYPMYEMTYYGDYGFDEFLGTGAENDKDIEKFVMKRLLKGLPINLSLTGPGCTAFVTESDEGDIIFARNLDFKYSPSLRLKTRPKNGYASISTVNLSFSGYSKDNLPAHMRANSFLTLAAPYLPLDGMNEKGVAIAILSVPEVQMKKDEKKITINTTTAIRLVLDKAATVDEAVELMSKYNIYFSGDIKCHFLIGDKSGKSVIVEYWNGGLQVVKSEKPYQIASNFIAYNGLNIGEGYDEFKRYDAVKERIQVANGILTKDQTVNLLSEVGIYGDTGEDRLQWSVVYNLTDINGYGFTHRNRKSLIDFTLK